jgi:hypothetical protein
MKKLAIVGAEAQTRHLAPYDDQDYVIWVFNEWGNAEWCKRWDAVIQVHNPSVYKDINNKKDPQHWDWLKRKHGKPIYMQDVDPQVPDSRRYPIEQVLELMSNIRYKGEKQKYFRATISYAIALALYLGYKEIHIYGVELSHHAEYKSQRDNFIFWNGVAAGRGVVINLHCCNGLFDRPLYGFEEYMQEDAIQRYIEGITAQLEEAKKRVYQLEGALMLAQQMLSEKGNDVKEVSQPVQKEG